MIDCFAAAEVGRGSIFRGTSADVPGSGSQPPDNGAKASDQPASSSSAGSRSVVEPQRSKFEPPDRTGTRDFSQSGDGIAGSKGAAFPPKGRRWTLRSHLDGARCVLGDEADGVLVSCGEDALVKCWDLSPLWRSAPNADEIEPYATLRGHTSPVLALAYRQHDRLLFSAGMDYCVRAWRLPDTATHDLYLRNLTGQELAARAGLLVGHSDVVWGLQQHPHLPYLASASADGTIGLWAVDVDTLSRETGSMETSLVLNQSPNGAKGSSSGRTADGRGEAGGDAYSELPSCVTWVPANAAWLLSGYTSSKIAVFDVNRSTKVFELMPSAEQGTNDGRNDGSPDVAQLASTAQSRSVTSACCHQVMPLVVTGHTDGSARLADLKTGRFVMNFSDHPDAVTSVTLDPTRSHRLITGCHDGSIRSFDLRVSGQRCLERLRLHQAKYNEALHSVYHASSFLATAGADGNVAVLLFAE